MGDPGPGGLPAGEPVPAAVGRGDRVLRVAPGATRRALLELTALWVGALLPMRAVVTLYEGGALPELALAAVPILFIYAPVLVCRLRGVDSWSYRLSIPALRDWPAWRQALALNLRTLVVLAVPYMAGYHLYQSLLFGHGPGHGVPRDIGTLVAYQVFFVAIPEEFFYRGYFQTRLNEVFPRRFLVFGAPIGWGAVVAGLYFAFGHSLVQFQWWHFATFFPGLMFAWMRERTGGVTAGALFHGACNVAAAFLDTWYGIR